MAEYYYLKYNPYIYNINNSKKYGALIRKADGTHVRVKPVIYTKIDVAIANRAIAGMSKAG